MTPHETTDSAEHGHPNLSAGQQNGTPPKEHSTTDASYPVWSVEAGEMLVCEL